MADNPDKKSSNKTPKGQAGSTGPMQLRAAARTVQVNHLDEPPKIERPKRIHPRRLLPFVKEGRERPFHSMSTRAVIHALDAQQDLKVVLNTELTEPGRNHTAGNVGEPSVSINGDVVFYTGNWYAAMSQDGGQSFQFIDPNSMAQANDGPNVTFCCDQVVNYLPSIDTFVWLLQYGPSTGNNLQRLAFAKTEDVKAGKWRTFDITTDALGVPGFFLDFPDLAVGSNFLYMTTNCFGPDPNTVGSAVVRIPISSIDSGNPTAEKFVSMELFSFRVAQNCGSTAYFAAHRDTSTLAVFSWPEGQPTPASQDVGVARWIGTNGYVSRTKDGRRWLDRSDPRITGATLAGNELWFAWAVDSDSNHRPRPFVQMARINTTNLSLIENVNLWDPDSAICYAGLATNANNEVGVSYMIGGGDVFPSHVVGIMTNDQKSLMVGKGDRSPLPDQQGHYDWGDYLTARPVFPDRKLFAAGGYSFKGTVDSDNQDATPRFVIFGRASDTTTGAGGATTGDGGGAAPTDGGGTPTGDGGGGAPAPGDGGTGVVGGEGGGDGGSTTGDGGPTTGDGGVGSGPITDVNKLKTVSSAVARQIKDACGVNSGTRAAARPAAFQAPLMVTKPGKERWPVKTGQDDDRNMVGKNVINGKNLGAGIVETTVAELVSIPRPPGLEDEKADPPEFQSKRAQPVETTIWRVDVTITTLLQETDGDLHLVLQGPSGDTIIGEIPTPTSPFIGDSPWAQNITEARQAVDDKLIHNLNPQDFVLPPGGTKLVPRNALSGDYAPVPMAAFRLPQSFRTPAPGQEANMPAFKTRINPVAARITGVGFFDRAHGQTGVAPNVFELHPILRVEWL